MYKDTYLNLEELVKEIEWSYKSFGDEKLIVDILDRSDTNGIRLFYN